jgi:bla regulator protein blaR1
MTAYDVQTFQISAPDWLSTARYDIAANVPPGATKEQVDVMWQNLLKERFALAVHHESKEFQVDELTVAKGGLKLKETDLGPNPDPFAPPEGPNPFKNGIPEMNGFGYIVMISADSTGPRARAVAKGLTLADFAARLGQNLRHPVIDKTGLAGRYDFTLEYVPDLSGMQLPPPPLGAAGPPPSATASAVGASDPGSNLAAAVEKQLGLKLTRAKAQLDVIVVDRIEKTPAQN